MSTRGECRQNCEETFTVPLSSHVGLFNPFQTKGGSTEIICTILPISKSINANNLNLLHSWNPILTREYYTIKYSNDLKNKDSANNTNERIKYHFVNKSIEFDKFPKNQ